METSPSSINQAVENTEMTNGSRSNEGVIKGDINLNSKASDRQDSQPGIFVNITPAAFNYTRQYAPECLPGTRTAVLQQIGKWATGDNTPRVYWLQGTTGTGKSTIARTIAREQHERGLLGAGFCFSGGGGVLASPEYFAAAVAAQLRECSPEVKKHFDHSAVIDPRIQKSMLYDQWKKLVMEPLAKSISLPRGLLIVIEDLDQCDDSPSYTDTTLALIVQCLKDVTLIDNVDVRVLVTSRPDGAIKQKFEGTLDEAYQTLSLDDIEKSIVNDDLNLFYKAKLSELDENGLRCSDEDINCLVDKSHGLFIHAAATYRFILSGGASDHSRLSSLLVSEEDTENAEMNLDRLYSEILESSSPPNLDIETRVTEKELFHQVIGSLVIMFDVMTLPNLAMLLGEPEDRVRGMLNRQRSMVEVPESDMPVQPLHPKFREFLLDPTRCRHPDFSIDPKEAHSRLFRACVRAMREHLRYNMCRLSQPATNERPRISKADIEQHVPVAVQYASCYWVHHLRRSKIDPMVDADVFEFLSHWFLFWLEALALIGRLSDSILMIRTLGEMVPPPPPRPLSYFESDVLNLHSSTRDRAQRRFKRLFGKSQWGMTYRYSKELDSSSIFPDDPALPLEDAMPLPRVMVQATNFIKKIVPWIERPLEVYSLAMYIVPESYSIPRQLYYRGASSSNGSPRGWPGGLTLQAFGVSSLLKAVTFSQDGGLIAVGSRGGNVHIWTTSTRTQIEALSTEKNVASMAFSTDRRLIVIGFEDSDILVFDLTLSKSLHWLKTDQQVLEVRFSPSGDLVASCLTAVYIWNATTGTKLHTLVHFPVLAWGELRKLSPDCSTIATYLVSREIGIRDIMTGATQELLKIDKDLIPHHVLSHEPGTLELSPSGKLAVFDHDATREQAAFFNFTPGENRIWSSSFFDEPGTYSKFAFSLDSELLAVAKGTIVKIFHIERWEVVAWLQSPGDLITALSFSSCKKFLVTGSLSGLVHLWDIETSERWNLPTWEPHFTVKEPDHIQKDDSHFQRGGRSVRRWYNRLLKSESR